MSEKELRYQYRFRRDTAASWLAVNPVLAVGEVGKDITNNIEKIGDGVTPWSALGRLVGDDGDEQEPLNIRDDNYDLDLNIDLNFGDKVVGVWVSGSVSQETKNAIIARLGGLYKGSSPTQGIGEVAPACNLNVRNYYKKSGNSKVKILTMTAMHGVEI